MYEYSYNHSMPPDMLYRKRLIVIEFVLLILIPISLLQIFPQLLILRTVAMLLGLLYIYLMGRKYNFNRKTLGISGLWDCMHPIKDIAPLLVVSTVLLYGVAQFNRTLIMLPVIQQSSLQLSLLGSILLYSIISVPLQELIFRGFYISRLEVVIKRRWLIILLSSFTFALVHIPFKSWFLTFGCFVMGIMLANHYLKHRNLASIVLAHAWLGSLVVVFNSHALNWETGAERFLTLLNRIMG